MKLYVSYISSCINGIALCGFLIENAVALLKRGKLNQSVEYPLLIYYTKLKSEHYGSYFRFSNLEMRHKIIDG